MSPDIKKEAEGENLQKRQEEGSMMRYDKTLENGKENKNKSVKRAMERELWKSTMKRNGC